jgi:SAM-dependent methyltransferase
MQYDLHTFNLAKRDFDFAILNQTIEHLYNPMLAIRNIYKHLKQGGMFYTNVPVNNIPHCDPFHFYTGLTPTGLAVMIKLAGFDILKVGQWGNKIYQRQMFDHIWSNYTYDKNPGYNDLDCPLVTWCWAIK